jgi:hypothetical protein
LLLLCFIPVFLVLYSAIPSSSHKYFVLENSNCNFLLSDGVSSLLVAMNPEDNARRSRMSKSIVLHDYNMLGLIIDYLPAKGCLAFVHTNKTIYECYTKYFKRPLQSDELLYCSSAEQIAWLQTQLPKPNQFDQYSVSNKVCFGTIASGSSLSVFWKYFWESDFPKNELDDTRDPYVKGYAEYGTEDRYVFNLPMNYLFSTVAVKYGNMDMIKYFSKRWTTGEKNRLLQIAAKAGHQHILEYLMSDFRTVYATIDVLREAAGGGHLETLQYLYNHNNNCNHGSSWDVATGEVAATNGHIHVLQWLNSLDPPVKVWGKTLYEEVIRERTLNGRMLKWLLANKPDVKHERDLTVVAVRHNNIEALKLLFEHGIPLAPVKKLVQFNYKSVSVATAVPLLTYLNEIGYLSGAARKSSDLCNRVIAAGDLDALKFLRSLDPPCYWSDATSRFAIQNNKLDILEWMREQEPPCPLHARCCRSVSLHGECTDEHSIAMLNFLIYECGMKCNVEYSFSTALDENSFVLAMYFGNMSSDDPAKMKTAGIAVEFLSEIGNYRVFYDSNAKVINYSFDFRRIEMFALLTQRFENLLVSSVFGSAAFKNMVACCTAPLDNPALLELDESYECEKIAKKVTAWVKKNVPALHKCLSLGKEPYMLDLRDGVPVPASHLPPHLPL